MRTDVQQEILRIRHLIEAGQRATDAGGAHFVAWGLLAALGAVATHLVIEQQLDLPLWLVWGAVLAPGWILASWTAIRTRERALARTVADRLLAYLWAGCGITMTAAAVSAAGDLLPGHAVAGIVALVLGAGYCGSAPLIGRWLLVLAGAWWSGGLVLLLFSQLPTLLVFAALMILFQVIPGIVLLARSRR